MSAVPKEQQYKGLWDVIKRVPQQQGGYLALFRGVLPPPGCPCNGHPAGSSSGGNSSNSSS